MVVVLTTVAVSGTEVVVVVAVEVVVVKMVRSLAMCVEEEREGTSGRGQYRTGIEPVVGKRDVANRRHRGLLSRPRCPKSLDDAAGQKHADVVQNRVEVRAKHHHVQIGVRVERLAVTAQHDA